jgi:hypothetical protein
MQLRKLVIASLVAAGYALSASAAFAQELTNVPSANPRILGVSSATVLSPELAQIVRAQGSMLVENPAGLVKYYGYLDNQPNLLPALGSIVRRARRNRTRTPTVLRGLTGFDPNYDYGTRFLFQGHEAGTAALSPASISTPMPHRVTVLATSENNGVALPAFDGSTWYPWSERLLLTAEGNGTTTGGVWQATPGSLGC